MKENKQQEGQQINQKTSSILKVLFTNGSGSKSKDGKGGWVNVVTGGTCASDKREGNSKCVSSSKRASIE